MEYKKVEKFIRREETWQKNNLFKERSEKCNIYSATDSKTLSTIECTNIVNKSELKINIQELNLSNEKKIKIPYPTEAIKDANFEYEEEWDIGGIPELLNELDADIEKSLTNIQSLKCNGIKNAINNKQDTPNTIQEKHCEKQNVSNNLSSHKSENSLRNLNNEISLEKNILTSTFTGFSKGGHLISNSTNSIRLCSTLYDNNIGHRLKPIKILEEQDCTISMSSQAGNNGNTSSNISGTGINISCGQNISGSNNNNKPNNKMSIDHQATLDKGLKMKIKRTKPGTKSSEAKHEIVKANEQQQNGLIGSGSSICPINQEDVNCLPSNQSTPSNSQNCNVTLGISNSHGNSNLSGNKKILGSGNNQNNMSSTIGNISLNSTASNVSQTLSQGAKRGSSGHRREKTKEKSSHSSRIGIEKNASVINEKEPIERPLCHCCNADVSCSNNSCIKKTENNTLTQRLPAKSSCGNISVLPPGVFTPSTDTPTPSVVSNILAVTTAVSTPVCTQTVSSGVNANTPGPPSKEISSSNSSNVKISSHIAAQLAAAAASNGSCNTSTSFQKSDLKSSSNVQSQIVKQLSPTPISASVNHTLSVTVSNQKTSSILSTVGTETSMTISNLKNENLESPPAKRVKQTDNNDISLSTNKEMVDICIGTSVGTITEPDCLGPCEPGTSVTLEGIVWHETEGGVLVVNVTWRGKTYVGTLLDCTRHDWAPPRFCDSPTEDFDARTPKGRGKRARTTITPDLSNFTETRSSIYFSHSHVHSKLRNGSTKGGRGSSRTTSVPALDKANSGPSLPSGNGGLTPSTSPTAFLPPRAEKRKSKDESPPPAIVDNETVNSSTSNASSIPISTNAVSGLTNQTQHLINPVTGLNVQISTKKCKTSSPCAISPVLLECPENDCSKKYKHVNGLRYHQSHAHGSTSLLDEDSMAEVEEHITPQPSPLSSTPTPSLTPNPSDLISNNQIAISLQPAADQLSEYSTKKLNEESISQQLENCENKISETVSSLSCVDILTSTPTVSCSSECVSARTTENEQEKQFLDLVENTKINMNTVNSLESQSKVTGKSGVLRLRQGETSNNNGSCLLPSNSLNEIPFQSESLDTSLTKQCISGPQDPINDVFCTESSEKVTNQNQNQNSITTSKTSTVTPVGPKTKKERKSPVSDYETDKVNTCNISREDVQSPAYSDISDDSTPVNESDHVDKINVSKNSDVLKKTTDMGSSVSATGPSSQTNISSTLSNYGVYQFYQQQQFIVPPAAEQQQSAKNSLSPNVGCSLTQQPTVSEFESKKDPPLDLILKANSNQHHSNQHCQEINKDSTRTICATSSQGNNEISNVPSIGTGTLNSTTPSKSVSHFYAFNYVPSNYPFNVDHNFGSTGSITTSEEISKPNKLSGISSPNDQLQQQQVLYKDDRPKEDISSVDTVKSANLQIPSKHLMKTDSIAKSESNKQESLCNPLTQIPQHLQMQGKDHQGISVYPNMYQRHPLTLASQQLSREEELRRYYIFTEQQRRHSSSSHNSINQPIQNTAPLSGGQQCKDDTLSLSQQHTMQHNQQHLKIKGNASLNTSKSVSSANTSKESPKPKHEEEIKVLKQEGQKPTMETQGPPPPPTSQYFLHPSYITSTPFGFDPNHPMYRNVLMPATSPYNTPPYHLPIPRYHAPEDLSRNTGTKALDALHHAASQYYTTHKIHELSERALKSPNNSNLNNVSSTNKISGSSPNIVPTQHSNIGSNIVGHLAVQSQSPNVTQLQHNLSSQTISVVNKQDVIGQKAHGNGPTVAGAIHSETQKSQTAVNSPAVSSCNSGNGSSNNGNNVSSVNTTDSRSPPPQRHVHTHHHTHVGLGYPMYPAPYGAAVLASQQAAAVAVINPFPPGPSK